MSQRLSARQEECLRLTAFLTDKEIAVRLGLSEATVKKHVHEACRRMGVNRRKAALALLEQKVPGPKDPIGGGRVSPAHLSRDREIEYEGHETPAPSPLDLGRPGGGAERVQPNGGEPSGLQPPPERTGGRRGADEPARTPATGSERGLGDGPGRSPERRLGYRPPPRGWGVRLLILLVAIVVTAVMLRAVAGLVLDYADQAKEIGYATAPRNG